MHPTQEEAALPGTAYTCTLDDLIAGYRLKFRLSPLRRGMLPVLVVVFAAYMFYVTDDNRARVIGVALVAAALALIFALNRFVLFPMIVRREFRRYPLLAQETFLELTPEGYRISFDRGGAAYRWSDFIGWRGDDKAFILYASPKIFVTFPARLETLGFPYREMRDRVERNIRHKA